MMKMMTVHVSCRVSRGVQKAECEDSCLVGTAVINDSAVSLDSTAPTMVCLCDGVGGNAGGRDASLFLCREIGNAVNHSEVTEALKKLNGELIEYGIQSGKPTMASTLTGLIFRDDRITLIHAGNTRLYTIRGGFLNQITTDHTTYEWLKSIGNTEAAEACNRSEIRCAFGAGNPDYLKQLVVRPVFDDRRPKLLLMTTDGIHDYLTNDEMENILGTEMTDQEKIDSLIERAGEKGSKDDRSAMMIRIIEIK